MDIKIIKATIIDIEELQSISIQTFFETFTEYNTLENMKQYLDERFNVDKLNKELTNSNSEFYFASIANQVAGYLKVNKGQSQSELIDKQAFEIERIYVLKEYFGKQVGQLLFNKALQLAKSTHANYLWLGVWENNERAINFYKKNSMVEFDKHTFMLGEDKQTDIMMKLELIN